MSPTSADAESARKALGASDEEIRGLLEGDFLFLMRRAG